jgi:hypothetical protein
MISGEMPKVLIHTAHDTGGKPLVTTLVGGWDNVLGHIFDHNFPTKWFDFHINPWGLVEVEIPIHHELLIDLAKENPRKMIVVTICNSATNDGHEHVVFYSLSAEIKNLDVFLGKLTEKDREVFDNCACGAVHYSNCLCLASLALHGILGNPNDTRPSSEE